MPGQRRDLTVQLAATSLVKPGYARWYPQRGRPSSPGPRLVPSAGNGPDQVDDAGSNPAPGTRSASERPLTK